MAAFLLVIESDFQFFGGLQRVEDVLLFVCERGIFFRRILREGGEQKGESEE